MPPSREAEGASAHLGRGEAWISFLLAALLATAIGLRSQITVLHGELINPDTFMRLDRLRDMLAQGRILDAVMRDGSGQGTVLHWSHCLDLLLLILAAPVRLFTTWPEALHAAALVFGPLCVGAAGLAAAWAGAPLSAGAMRWTAAALAAISMPVAGYGLPGVVHHHVLLGVVALLLAGLAGRLIAGAPASGPRLGAVAAIGIWLSPESLPFILLAFGAVGLAWALAHDRRPIARAIVHTAAVFLALILLLWAVDSPAAGHAAFELDRLSATYLVLAVIVAAVALGLHALPNRPLVGLALAIAGIALWIGLFPALLGGTDAAAPDAKALFPGIMEMMPVSTVPQAITFLGGGVFALAMCLWLAWRDRSLLWAYGAAVAVILIALGAQHLRFSAYPTLAGAAAVPVLLAGITQRLPPGKAVFGRLGVLVAALLVTRVASLAPYLGAKPDDIGAGALPCDTLALPQVLDSHPDAVVLSDVNIVPEILWRTPVRTVGSLYHRNVPAYLRLRAAWREIPGPAPGPAFLATRASLVLACPGGPRSSLVGDLPETTLMDRLRANAPPPWLQRVPGDAPGGWVLYRLDR
jgi:hypothetical protein